MGVMYEQCYRSLFLPNKQPYHEEDLDAGPVGARVSRSTTSARQVTIETEGSAQPQARYRDEIQIEWSSVARELDEELLGWRMAWNRNECHAQSKIIRRADSLVVAQYPFAALRRYDHIKFRRGRQQTLRAYLGGKLGKQIARARSEGRPDLDGAVKEFLDDETRLKRDPFNSGKGLFAGLSIPSRPFGDVPTGHIGPGWEAADGELARTAWVFGTCTNAREVYRLVRIELDQLIVRKATQQARGEGSTVTDERLRRARGGKLVGDTPDRADPLSEHAVWLAMAGPGPGEAIPENRSVAQVALRRLEDLLYNLNRRVKRAYSKGFVPHAR